MEDRAELELCRRIVRARETVVCRLTASIEVLEQRVKTRELGLWQREYVGRVAKLNAVVEQARFEDFTVIDENRSVTEVARECWSRLSGFQAEALPPFCEI
jgi:hypothetical protein